MVDTEAGTASENFLTFADARTQEPLSLLPRRIDVATLWRWHRKGCVAPSGARVHLRCWRVGKRLYTRKNALREFFEAVSDTPSAPPTPTFSANTPSRSESARGRCMAEAQHRLAAAGI
jgi:hypothetical protein